MKEPPPPPPRTIEERANTLGPIYAFDPDAFRGDNEASQELCDAMLSLSLVFNDCRERLLLMERLVYEMPDAPPPPANLNRSVGEHGGATVHASRLFVGLVHEVGEVIRDNGRALNEPFFQDKVIAQLPPRALEMWNRVKNLALGKKPDKAMDELAEFLRNKTAYHYDGAALREGYDRRFPSGSRERTKQPLVSLGNTVYGRRFYFADAVAANLIEQGAHERNLAPFGPKMSEILRDLSFTLALVVEAFIVARTRGKWRPFPEDPLSERRA
jgi:hypothetical protein